MPNKSQPEYKNGIEVGEDMRIQLIGYNPEGKSTEVFEVNYVIDTSVETKIKDIIITAYDKIDNTEVGTEVGDCVEGAKEELAEVAEKGEKLLKIDAVSVDDGNKMITMLENALLKFEQKTIVPTNKGALRTVIEKAETMHANAIEGSNIGQYRVGAKNDFNLKITEAKEVYDDILARQEGIDKAAEELSKACVDFEAEKISEMDKKLTDAGITTGPVTVSLLWNSGNDLDLYVLSPRGDVINYSNRRGSSGGELERDDTGSVSNPVENIYWNNPPRGTYKVMVNVYSNSTGANIPVTIRTLIDGKEKVYNKTVVSGLNTICTFNY